MTINSNTFINTINTLIANTSLANTDIDKAISSFRTLNTTNSAVSVASTSNLPVASKNTGRMIYVTDESKYYYSDGTDWITDFTPKNIFSGSDILTFGDGIYGTLGNNSELDQCSPVSIVGAINDWKKVSVGAFFTTALRTNGTLWAWGDAGLGRLGDNSLVDKSSPVSVVGGFTDWCDVSAGWFTAGGIRTNGTLWTWGQGICGGLGDGTTTDKSSPVSVVGGFTDWCQVSIGTSCNGFAIRQNGTLWSWGSNSCGRLGDGTTVSKSSPVSVVGGFTDWCQVSAGHCSAAAVRQDGTLWTWGRGNDGRLGNNSTTDRSSPVSAVGGFTDWCQVAMGMINALGVAVRQNGTLWAWGSGASGALGDGTTVNKSSPVSVVGGFTDWCQVDAGDSSVFAIRTNGTLWSWGYNRCGNLGDGTTVNKCSPVLVVGEINNWCQVSGSSQHAAAIKNNFTR